jgi:hypothetical protein
MAGAEARGVGKQSQHQPQAKAVGCLHRETLSLSSAPRGLWLRHSPNSRAPMGRTTNATVCLAQARGRRAAACRKVSEDARGGGWLASRRFPSTQLAVCAPHLRRPPRTKAAQRTRFPRERSWAPQTCPAGCRRQSRRLCTCEQEQERGVSNRGSQANQGRDQRRPAVPRCNCLGLPRLKRLTLEGRAHHHAQHQLHVELPARGSSGVGAAGLLVGSRHV